MPFPDAKYPFDQRMVKAAPDLLAVAKELLLLRCLCGYTTTNDSATHRAVHVIAKAEGRTDDQ